MLYCFDKSFSIKDADLMTGIAVVRFSFVRSFKFGSPNDEALSGHRYYSLGLRGAAGFEVLESEWINELEKANRVHSQHNPLRFKILKHFIIVFKESVFECIAEDFALEFYANKSKQEVIAMVAEQL